MYHEQPDNKKQKRITSFLVILAVVIVTVGINIHNKDEASEASAATSSVYQAQPKPSPSTSTSQSSVSTATGSSAFKDGTYTSSSNYGTPGGVEGITVDVTIKNGVVARASVQNQSNNRTSQDYQNSFTDSYKPYVVGRKLSDISVSRISGSSLTSEGFNEALQQIKNQAQIS